MTWREKYLTNCGPGILAGITLGQWVRLLREHGRSIHPAYWLRMLPITLLSARNSFMRRAEQRRFADAVNQVALHPPLFVLGHWRSGTTHLHQLLAQDNRFAFPNTYQVLFPHTFLTTEARDARRFARVLPKHRPLDNMEWSATSPQEDEFGICVTTLKSPYLVSVFPKAIRKYSRYLTFRGVPPAEVAEWRRAFEFFLKKVQWRHDRPLVLKSPAHTARVRLLLEMFPSARFVHIHRNPYTVFQSTRRMLGKMAAEQLLQKPDWNLLEDWIIQQYQEMHDVFFEEKNLIPTGCFHEVAFEQLEQDPVGEVRQTYEALDLPAFADVEPALRRYVASLAGFKKIEHPELAPKLRARLATAWKRSFDEWGYAI